MRKEASRVLLLAAALTAFMAAAAHEAFAQRFGNFSSGPRGGMPSMGGRGGMDGGGRGPNWDRGPRGPGIGIGTGVIILGTPGLASPQAAPPPPPQQRRHAARNTGGSGAPPAGETRYVPDEIVIWLAGNPSNALLDSLARRFRLTRLESSRVALANMTMYRWRIPDGRSVPNVIRELEQGGAAPFVQPNYFFVTSQQPQPQPASLNPQGPVAEGDPAQYVLAKLQLPLAHRLARGSKVTVAVIDSGIDAEHPELAGVIADRFDPVAGGAHAHGTAIAGAIASHSRLMGIAPSAQILAIRAFDPSGNGAQGTTFSIIQGLDWAVSKGAQVVNMSFAGPSDPGLARNLAAARSKGVVLIAAAGNAGAKSPPLYPAADPNVIAVSATDAEDKIFTASNRGNHIAITAPGVDILLPSPGGSYQVTSGTSFAAAHVSGIAALLLERRPTLGHDGVRRILLSTARDLGPKGADPEFGAGLADAYRALTAVDQLPAGAMTSNASAVR